MTSRGVRAEEPTILYVRLPKVCCLYKMIASPSFPCLYFKRKTTIELIVIYRDLDLEIEEIGNKKVKNISIFDFTKEGEFVINICDSVKLT